jgi:hypothetical protein
MAALVVVIAAVTKFTAGAWVVVILVPLIVLACRRIHRHYQVAREALVPDAAGEHRDHIRPPARAGDRRTYTAAAETADTPAEVTNMIVVPVSVLDLAALHALAYAASLTQPVLAVHVSPSNDEAHRFRRYWEAWGEHLPLEVPVSPYRATIAPLANYIEALHHERPDVTITVVVPEIVPRHRWQRILHDRLAARLRPTLLPYEGLVITSVPFHLPA